MKKNFILILIAIVAFASCKPTSTDYIRQSLLDSLTKINPAIGNVSKQIKDNPKNAELYFSRGSLFFQMHQLTLAAADLHKAITLDSLKVPYYLTFADVNIEANYVPLAMKYLQQAKKIAPNDRALSKKLSKTYLYLKEYDAALAETNSILTVDPNDASALFLQGMIFKDKGDTSRALSLFKLTAEADPNNYDVYMQLGLLNNFRNKKLAERYFLNAIRIDSTKYEGNYALAMYYQNGKDYKRAIAQYKKMILQNPQAGQPFYNLGCIYFQIDSLQKAFSNFSIAIANSPTNADAHFMRGLCWELRKNKHEAIIDFQNATNLRSNFTDAENALKRLEVK